jgi:hypothetical protein
MDSYTDRTAAAAVATVAAAAAAAACQMVVHYQLPASADTYIHRSGRTARTGGSDGVALVRHCSWTGCLEKDLGVRGHWGRGWIEAMRPAGQPTSPPSL